MSAKNLKEKDVEIVLGSEGETMIKKISESSFPKVALTKLSDNELKKSCSPVKISKKAGKQRKQATVKISEKYGRPRRKVLGSTLEKKVVEENFDESPVEYLSEDEESDTSLPISSVRTSKESQEWTVETLISRAKKNLNFEEIKKCLEESPYFTADGSRVRDVDETSSSYEELHDETDEECSPSTSAGNEPLKRKRKRTLEEPVKSTPTGKGTGLKKKGFNYFIPKDGPNTEELAAPSKNYEVAVNALLNVDVSEEKENDVPVSNPVPLKPPTFVDRKSTFKLKNPMEGYDQSPASQECAIIDINKLNELYNQNVLIICRYCDSDKAEFNLSKTQNPTLQAKCTHCYKILGEVPLQESVNLPVGDDVTVKTNLMVSRMCTAALNAGVDYTTFQRFLSYTDLLTISESEFRTYTTNTLLIIEDLFKKIKDQASKIVTNYYLKLGFKLKDGMMNVQVSFAGTWLIRGNACLIGIGFIIEIETGIILDYHVLKKDCNVCKEHYKKEKCMTYKQIETWKENHKPDCHANYDKAKSSSSIEGELAEILFKRSTDRKLRYTQILTDKNFKTLTRLQELNPYGDAYPIEKKSALDHINKEIYRQLNRLSTTHHLGGEGEGKLTKRTALIFTNFYRVFVKKYHDNHALLKKNIMASVFHHAATDKHPLHQLCPRGKDSWCKYQKDLSNNIKISKNWHEDKKNRKYSLGREPALAVLEVMFRMTSDDVLAVVSSGMKHINQSVQSKVWAMLPPSEVSSLIEVRYAAARVALVHNCGEEAVKILNSLGIDSGEDLKKKRKKKKKKKAKKSTTKTQIKRKRGS
ncbi:hypothetical protein Anas_10778 [Armadillidium nasatum]|uniref:Mutator-like transposase domain-containing protein n=1 Tax=Armadillidium nasatum TaxID=96803 RepID=A0A5N5SUF2_9CRUS|nr:hypothetical protein Anas_10778 [Armadillidium nasatum]